MRIIAKRHEGHGLSNRILNAVKGTVCMQFEKEKYVARLYLNSNISRTMIKYLCNKWIKLQACNFLN
jgi:hypothetical protein